MAVKSAQGMFLFGRNRLENLTDAIFAFAMTLLVLNIAVPQQLPAVTQGDPIAGLLLNLFPDFFHYFAAFLVLAGFWLAHHSYFEHVGRMDRSTIWLGLAALLMIALVPFSTQLADTYTRYPLSAVFFDCNIIAIGALFYLQWSSAIKKGFLNEKLGAGDISNHKKIILVMPAIAVAAIILALFGATWSTALFFLVPLAYPLLLHKPRS